MAGRRKVEPVGEVESRRVGGGVKEQEEREREREKRSLENVKYIKEYT